ncbi:hypothetical protein L1987_81239 [Smallanthus sonchifolius]|uniref:Uncharacterized protein n=1 Tax=Smallanthus sonchifolius TaxID=185202 RepID=A0ACB8YPW0_9ASTR|nr:hypothetical protein L1987_81239 [Smallanthus sonchifolius]
MVQITKRNCLRMSRVPIKFAKLTGAHHSLRYNMMISGGPVLDIVTRIENSGNFKSIKLVHITQRICLLPSSRVVFSLQADSTLGFLSLHSKVDMDDQNPGGSNQQEDDDYGFLNDESPVHNLFFSHDPPAIDDLFPDEHQNHDDLFDGLNLPNAQHGNFEEGIQALIVDDEDNFVDGFFEPVLPIPELPHPRFGDNHLAGARLPILPPPEVPQLPPAVIPSPRAFASITFFRGAVHQLRAAALDGNPVAADVITSSLEPISNAFEMLSQKLTTRRRYPESLNQLSDFFGLSSNQVRQHANISRGVLRTRYRGYGYARWPQQGDAITMPLVILYTGGFHVLAYCMRDVSFAQFEHMLGALCSTHVGQFVIRFAREREYIELNSVDAWAQCLNDYTELGMRRLELFVTSQV